MRNQWRRLTSVLGFCVIFGAAQQQLMAQETEKPFPVEPGRLEIEMDAISVDFERDRTTDRKVTALGVARTVAATGLTRNLDLQVGFDLYLHESYEVGEGRDSRSGIGDMTFRAKWLFWYDREAGTAIALLPYVKVPTGSGGLGGDSIEGGLIIPAEIGLWGGVRAGGQFQWDYRRNDADDGYDSRWYVSAYADRKLTSLFSVYSEAAISLTTARLSDWTGTVAVGATVSVSDKVRWDYSLIRGVNRNATDWGHVLRLTWGM